MSANKQAYIQSIRASSAYPVYRGIIGVIAMLGYAAAIGVALSGIAFAIASLKAVGAVSSSGIALLSLLTGLVVWLLIRFSKEAALMIADIADALTEGNARTR